MRALLSVVGTRGDVQPVLALAREVRALGHDVHLCVPPNFMALSQELGFTATSVGVEMRAPRAGAPPVPVPDLIANQFDAIGAAAKGFDIILGANAHQYAARSIAEHLGIPYVNALYAPTALPGDVNSRMWNERSLDRVNANRARLSLEPITDVLGHIVGDHPWLATDPTLDPPPARAGMVVRQSGAWLLADESPLSSELDKFLEAGEPPLYVGFGSMPVAEGTSRTIINAVRSAGRRAIVSEGWGNLVVSDQASDCISIGDVNQQALFPRVAAVVHHGGAGTTLAAARAGTPQVVVPMFSDQPYWASRVRELGIGASLPMAELSVDGLASAIQVALKPAVAEQAGVIAPKIVVDGAAVAARWLVEASR